VKFLVFLRLKFLQTNYLKSINVIIYNNFKKINKRMFSYLYAFSNYTFLT